MLVPDPEGGEIRCVWANEGYNLGVEGFVLRSPEFSSVEALSPMTVVPDANYFARFTLTLGDPLQVPECLPHVARRFEELDVARRDQFLRACYWLDRARVTWDISSSLSYLAIINAVESLVPAGGPPRPCPTCGKDRGQGPTARFQRFVTEYTGSPERRRELYELRSALAHGGRLLRVDVPRAWGDLEIRQREEIDTYGKAAQSARISLLNWLLGPSSG
jgi:hypothetical protein